MRLKHINTQFFEDSRQVISTANFHPTKKNPPLPTDGEKVFSFSYKPFNKNNFLVFKGHPYFFQYGDGGWETMMALYRKDKEEALTMVMDAPRFPIANMFWHGKAEKDVIDFFLTIGTYEEYKGRQVAAYYNKGWQRYPQPWIKSVYTIKEYEEF